MLKKRQVLTMITIAVISFVIGTTFNANLAALGSDEHGIPFAKIWEAIYGIQGRVTTLEESINAKTWHFVTSFTLSEEQPMSPLFFIQGEKWRIMWEPQPLPHVSFEGFIIWNEDGYAIEWVDIFRILEEKTDANGMHYVFHGEGSYYIQFLRYGGNVNFTIESYH